MTYLNYKPAHEIVGLLKAKEISPSELIEEIVQRIEAVNPKINAFVSLRFEQAMDEAKVLEKKITKGIKTGPLAGIPLAVKDLEDVHGMRTSFGSLIYKDNVAEQDSIHVHRLKGSGAIVIGKTNTPEFGFTFFTKNRLYGVTRNPWNTNKTPGGSSGGSSAALAGGMVPLATGSDAGGSIRTPAAYTGCFGLKTSAGRIPLDSFPGPQPILPNQPIAVLGPLTRTVKDAALFLDCTAGYHHADPFSLPFPQESYVKCLNNIPQNLKIAFSPTLGYAKVQKDILACVEESVKCFEEIGYKLEMYSEPLPDVQQAWSTLLNLDFYAQLFGDLEKNSKDLSKGLVMMLEGLHSFSVQDHVQAQKMRTKLNRALAKVFNNYDVLMTPTMPKEAFAAEGPPSAEIDGEPISILEFLAFTYPFNLSGNPAASIPAGLTMEGLPIGLQIIGPRCRDDLVLQISYAYEQQRPWHDQWSTLDLK